MKQYISLSLLFLLCAGCGSLPTAKNNSTFKLELPVEETLPNRLRAFWAYDDLLPKFQISILVPGGVSADPAGRGGLTAFSMAFLGEATTQRDSQKLAQALEELGAELSVVTTYDYSLISISGLSTAEDQVLTLLSEILGQRTVRSEDLKRKKMEVIQSFDRLTESPDDLTDMMGQSLMYQNSPYGRAIYGSKKNVSSFTSREILQHQERLLHPQNCLVAVSGRISEAFQKKITKELSRWSAPKSMPGVIFSSNAIDASGIYFFNQKSLPQVQVRFLLQGVPRSHPDFLKLRLVNTILGGGFTSRLMSRVRDDLGLTYSISSSLDAKKFSGDWQISTFTRNDKVYDVLKETKQITEKFANAGITQQELDNARTKMSAQFPTIVETSERLAYNAMLLKFYGVSLDYLTQYQNELASFKLPEINRILKTHFAESQWMVVMYGDKEKVSQWSQISEMGELKVLAPPKF